MATDIARVLVSAFLLLSYGLVSYNVWQLASFGGTPFAVASVIILALAIAATLGFLIYRTHWAWLLTLIEAIIITQLFFVFGIMLLLELIRVRFSVPITAFGDIVYVFGPIAFVILGAGSISLLLADKRLHR